MITIKTKPGKEYFRELKIRYEKATKRQKKTILDEFTQTTGYHRKHAIDLLTGNYKQHIGAIYRSHKTYTREDADILEQVWKLLGWIASKRMKPSLTLAGEILPGHWILLMLNLHGLNRHLCLIKLKFMSLLEFRGSEADCLFLCLDLILIVEQKNDSIVRNWVGYGRFNTQPQVDILNEFYELLRLYTNFFLPVMRLKKKTRVGSKIKKIYDKPTTPYRRVLRARDVSKEVKDKLRNQYKTLSLVKLKEQIDDVLKRLKPTKLE